MHQLIEVMSKGGFRLTKFLSNDRDVMKAMPGSERSKAVVSLYLDAGELPHEHPLGVGWNSERDTFV